MEKIGNAALIAILVFLLYSLHTTGPLTRLAKAQKCKKELALVGPVQGTGSTAKWNQQNMIDDALLRKCIVGE